MRRFLASIQSYFQGSYSGRYLGLLLFELWRADPKLFSQILKETGLKLPPEFSVRREWPFPGKAQNRLADLAVLDRRGQPLVLIEIKDADGITKPNETQLRDYMRVLEQSRTTLFLLLSRHIPRNDDEQELRKAERKKLRVRRLRFGELYRSLRVKHPLAQMVKDYLEDIGVTYRDTLDEKALRYLTAKMIGLSDKKGIGSLSNASPLGDLLDVLLGNLAFLGSWIDGNPKNKEVIRQRFRRHIYATPRYNLRRLSKDISKLNGQSDLQKYVIDGGVYFTSEANLVAAKGHWLSLEFGYWSWLTRVKSGNLEPNLGLYAQFSWKGGPEDIYGEKYFDDFPDQRKAQVALRRCLEDAVDKAKKTCPTKLVKHVDAFHVP